MRPINLLHYWCMCSPNAFSNANFCEPTDKVDVDMAIIARMTNRVRLYGIGCTAAVDRMLTLAAQYNIKVCVHLWGVCVFMCAFVRARFARP